jgi:hypothetical protein
MKGFFLATAFAATLAFGMPVTADAAKVKIYLGVPHYDYRVGPDYRFRDGYGWYRPVPVYKRGRLSCGEAKWRVRDKGFRNVSTIECRGATYTFKARRGDNRVTVYVNSRNGRVWRG